VFKGRFFIPLKVYGLVKFGFLYIHPFWVTGRQRYFDPFSAIAV
jgi:hypothetical protein